MRKRRSNLLYRLRRKGYRCDTRGRVIYFPADDAGGGKPYGNYPDRPSKAGVRFWCSIRNSLTRMSKFKEIIEITAPAYISPDAEGVHARETYHSAGHVCSYCRGNRWFWGEDETGERVKCDCPVCKGSGSLDAVITVEWTPSAVRP